MDKDIKQMLAENGLKATPQRLAVYRAVMESETHPTAEEVFSRTQELLPSISQASIYNTLEKFVGAGILKTVQSDGASQRYDFNTGKHHHLYCTESGRIKDYHDDKLAGIIKDYFRENNIPGFDIKDVNINIIGKFRR